jgi:hypothetical protein
MNRLVQNEERFHGTMIPVLTFHIHVSYSKTVRAEVTCCRGCQDARRKLEEGSTNLFLLALPIMLLLFLGIFLMMSYPTWGIYIIYLWFILLLALAVILIWRRIVERVAEKKYGPFCPACGTNLMPFFLRQIPYQSDWLGVVGHEAERLPNNITCPECRYQGPVSPYEGFWRYIDAYGPMEFSGTPLERMAMASYHIRHAPVNTK